MKSYYHLIFLGLYFHDKIWHRNLLLKVLEKFFCSAGPLVLMGGFCTHILLTLLQSVSKCTRKRLFLSRGQAGVTDKYFCLSLSSMGAF